MGFGLSQFEIKMAAERKLPGFAPHGTPAVTRETVANAIAEAIIENNKSIALEFEKLREELKK